MAEIYDPCRVFRKLAHNNALANLRLLTACEGLDADAFAAARTGFFPSIKATLNHILIVDLFYVDALEGGTLGLAAFENDQPCDSVASLAAAQGAVDRRLIAFVDGLDADRLVAITHVHRGTRVQHDRTDDILSHLFQHQTHHRGQAHTMLSGTSVPPPQLDEFIVSDDANLRRLELASLGWSETDLM